jgi:hypothetical protein
MRRTPTRGRELPALCARLTSLAAVVGMAGCSLLLDFDVPRDGGASETDAAGGGDGGGPIDAGGVAIDAADYCPTFEPNDTRESATPLAPGLYDNVAVCPGADNDFYSFALDGAQDLIVLITFENDGGQGDLEMQLFNDAGTVVAQSMGFSDSERIERSEAQGGRLPAGTYTARIYGFNALIQNDYVLELTVTPLPP